MICVCECCVVLFCSCERTTYWVGCKHSLLLLFKGGYPSFKTQPCRATSQPHSDEELQGGVCVPLAIFCASIVGLREPRTSRGPAPLRTKEKGSGVLSSRPNPTHLASEAVQSGWTGVSLKTGPLPVTQTNRRHPCCFLWCSSSQTISLWFPCNVIPQDLVYSHLQHY